MVSLGACLVTGANGYIGRGLCTVLKRKGCHVRALLRKPAHHLIHEAAVFDENHHDEVVYEDLKHLTRKMDLPALQPFMHVMQNIDTVFHLAGIAHATQSHSIRKEQYWQINVEATEQLLYLAHQAGVKRFIYFSSVKAEGCPTDDYGSSKKAAEDSVLFLGKKYGIHVVILRPALVYGPVCGSKIYGTKMKGNLAMMMRGIQQGWFPVLPEIKNQRSLVSIEDLIDAAICAAQKPEINGKIYTITDGKCYSSRQLYDEMRKALGKAPAKFAVPFCLFQILANTGDILQFILRRDLPFNSDALEKLFGEAYYPCQDFENDLGWKPKHDFSQINS